MAEETEVKKTLHRITVDFTDDGEDVFQSIAQDAKQDDRSLGVYLRRWLKANYDHRHE